jgi:hypothetical protein
MPDLSPAPARKTSARPPRETSSRARAVKTPTHPPSLGPVAASAHRFILVLLRRAGHHTDPWVALHRHRRPFVSAVARFAVQVVGVGLSPREKREAKMEIPQRSQHVEEDEQCA